MGNTSRRLVGYGATLAVASGLLYAGFVYEADADVGTLLSSAQVQLQLASQMPAEGKDGEPFAPRRDLLEEAKQILTQVEKQSPGQPVCAEYRAYVAFLEKRYPDAARLYAELRELPGCTDEMRDQSVINQVRMLRLAGKPQEARTVLEPAMASLSEKFVEVAQAELDGITGREASASKTEGRLESGQ